MRLNSLGYLFVFLVTYWHNRKILHLQGFGWSSWFRQVKKKSKLSIPPWPVGMHDILVTPQDKPSLTHHENRGNPTQLPVANSADQQFAEPNPPMLSTPATNFLVEPIGFRPLASCQSIGGIWWIPFSPNHVGLITSNYILSLPITYTVAFCWTFGISSRQALFTPCPPFLSWNCWGLSSINSSGVAPRNQ